MSGVYNSLADALNNLPNGFPRTESGVELEILKRIFTEAEAKIASTLTKEFESTKTIAKRNNLNKEIVNNQLKDMANKEMLWSTTKNQEHFYRLAPWIVGIWEAQLNSMDHSFAHLVEEYLHEGGMEGLMKPHSSFHRVVPAQTAVKTEWVLPYDDVKSLLESSKVFNVRDCVCRTHQDYIGNKCEFPINNCLTFSSYERAPRPGDISKEEAIALLDETEKIGLVHTVSNVMKGINYVCNCCGCCCTILRGVTEFGYENSVAVANYFAEVDVDTCIGCGVCEKRCQVAAIRLVDDKAVVDLAKCIGCGLCVTGCSVEAAKLFLKPEDEIVDPPENFGVWEEKRLQERGLA